MTNIPAYSSDILLQTEDKCIIILPINNQRARRERKPPTKRAGVYF